jgi:hypothetical protein
VKLKTSSQQKKWSLNWRPPTEWKKIFASYSSEKGLIIRIYRELKKLDSPQINEPINGQLN